MEIVEQIVEAALAQEALQLRSLIPGRSLK